MRLTQNKQLAADLSQETFLRALRALDDFRGDSSFKTWLYRIASNLWKNYLKKKRPISGIVEENDRVESARPDQKVEENERISRVREAINELPPEMRAALLLVRFEGMKYREAADALDISMSAIKSRMGRAYHRLEDKLEMKESSEESL